MKTLTLTIMAAAVVSACAITPHQEHTMPRGHSDQAVPATSTSDARRGSEPNVELQIYDNPDLHLAAFDPGPRVPPMFDGVQNGPGESGMLRAGAMVHRPAPGDRGARTSARTTNRRATAGTSRP
jgi:hypothetical protein